MENIFNDTIISNFNTFLYYFYIIIKYLIFYCIIQLVIFK